MEFPPHNVNVPEVSGTVPGLSQEFSCQIYDDSAFVGNEVTKPEADYRLFHTSFPSWDNAADTGERLMSSRISASPGMANGGLYRSICIC